MPADIPDTTPKPEIVATVVFVLLHTPLGTPSDNGIVDPAQTLVEPEMVPAVRSAPTVIGVVAVKVPHALVTP